MTSMNEMAFKIIPFVQFGKISELRFVVLQGA